METSFRSTPKATSSESTPSLRMQARPESRRSSTDASAALVLQGLLHEKEKEKSPYSRSHLRSRSSGSALLSAPLMTRANSMPNPNTPRSFEQPTVSTANSSRSPSPSLSQYQSPARTRSPFRAAQEESYMPPPRSPGWFESGPSGNAIQAIQEDSELHITFRPQSSALPTLPPHSSHSRSSSLRRRPASPLHGVANAAPVAPTSFPASVIDQNAPLNMTTSSGSSSPALGPQKYNEAYPSLHHYASSSSFSSIPSTPTSARSRSPSISSLDTIEDAPEQESEAIEAERIERLKIAAERAEQGESDSEGEGSGGTVKRRNGSLDVPRFGRTIGRERKRWSICGGERRADLDLETIWED
ncbi:hypothetical protein LTR37_006718 [Vermiconidia calcicola]|uniref:Uncharacterized protein n=1 Tax=Vermiconidia calcicola TaxID=1690605 RepID=A0ACC3NFQ3_9PEZI|nr:hypothetical protein LTR37_006718 [Vermiconidia calcicola]